MGLTVSKIVRGQRLEINYQSLKMQFMTVYSIALECILNSLPWKWFAIFRCFLLKHAH